MLDNFAVFILTHGRPDNVKTYATLQKQGYTGDVYFIIDNEDKTAEQYRKRYGDKVIMFDKAEIAARFDEADNFQDRRTITHARNASYEIAKKLGIRYFVQLDDDYTSFRFRYDANLKYNPVYRCSNLDKLFNAILDFYKSIPAATVAIGQGGDFIGGKDSTTGGHLWLKRKSMNSFFCDTSRRVNFVGRMNEDVCTYVTLGNKGHLFFSFFNVSLEQSESQSSAGGITETYLKYGTYVKSFYTVMFAPSCVKVHPMGGNTLGRIHHKINWQKAVPCIVSEEYRKKSQIAHEK